MRMNKEHKGKFFVPMYDIDLVWHTHQHMATLYKRDTEAYFGEKTNIFLREQLEKELLIISV